MLQAELAPTKLLLKTLF